MGALRADIIQLGPLRSQRPPAPLPSGRFVTFDDAALRLAELQMARPEVDESSAATLAANISQLLVTVIAALDEIESASEATDDDAASEATEQKSGVGYRIENVVASSLEDVAFLGGLELGRALRALDQAKSDDHLAIASEAALHKLQRVLLAVISSGKPSGTAAQAPSHSPGVELQSTLALRKLYAQFRRALRRPQSNDRDAVLTALRYAASALASLTASPHYHSIRVDDRALLRRQRDRLLGWAHAGKPTQAGRQLLDDIFTCAALLRHIDRRQELRAHDSALIYELVADPPLDRQSWLAQLEKLAGLDDELDALTEQLQAAGALAPFIDVTLRLAVLTDSF
jgi:hypothetical protein